MPYWESFLTSTGHTEKLDLLKYSGIVKIAIDHELHLGKIDQYEYNIPRGLMATIPGSHLGGPGSISGVGVLFC